MSIAMVTFGSLNAEKLGAKFISMGCDDNSVFQSVRVGVTTKMKENVILFLMGVHCFAY
jgi:hypothetical protein